MDEIVEIVRQIGRQQGGNAYYRACYGLLKHLQELVEQASDEMLRHQQIQILDQPSQSLGDIYGTLPNLQESTFDLIDQACDAQTSREEFCPIDCRFSACHIFPRRDFPHADHFLVEPLNLQGMEHLESSS
ncbi:hypothetical protein N7539_008475 [Penicillium diatomitis]|uniref:Uncharacterized protein n=1 Tax=Penicillium diatomitis TaxID=2819901 RepID=A0A9X0BLM4_9EURO|nr:uncharacterized protein N7539_008475 [Penicillium diatomitis]KAJ5471906.1 hypothetical protein N7539_008475 [Penicillium diatomitis]